MRTNSVEPGPSLEGRSDGGFPLTVGDVLEATAEANARMSKSGHPILVVWDLETVRHLTDTLNAIIGRRSVF